MASGKQLQPIIIKRVKKGGHAAHGGAWKIAYADFVTAMMAFFLLMWLLGSTAKGELQGIAEYFQNPIKVSLMGGTGTGNSDSILPGGGRDLSKQAGQVDSGDAERAAKLMGAQMARADDIKRARAREEQSRLDELEASIRSLIESKPELAAFKDQIQLQKTPDGLSILIVDNQNRPMFDTGSALVKPHMREILQTIGKAMGKVENRITLSGHTDATPYGNGDRGYSNWELSADRANATRRELVAGGLPDDKLVRVEGLASSRLLFPQRPNDPANRRISIVIMTREAEERMLPAPGAPQPVKPEPEAAAATPAVDTSHAPATGPVLVPPRPALQIPVDMTKTQATPRP